MWDRAKISDRLEQLRLIVRDGEQVVSAPVEDSLSHLRSCTESVECNSGAMDVELVEEPGGVLRLRAGVSADSLLHRALRRERPLR